MAPILTIVDKAWPAVAGLAMCVFTYGSLSSDVTRLGAAQAAVQTDHDTITRIDQSQKDMKGDLADIKHQLDRIENR